MRLVQTVLGSLLVHKQHKPHSLVSRSSTFNPSICLLMQYCKQQTLQVRNAVSEKCWDQRSKYLKTRLQFAPLIVGWLLVSLLVENVGSSLHESYPHHKKCYCKHSKCGNSLEKPLEPLRAIMWLREESTKQFHTRV